MTSGAPTPELTLRAPLSLFSLAFSAICPSREYPPPTFRSQIPESTPPFPYSLSPHRPTPGCPASQVSAPSPCPPDPGQLFGRSAGPCLLEGSGLRPARSPPLGPRPSAPSQLGFWLHARLLRAASGCESRFAPQPPGAPQPRALGEGGRAPGAGLVCSSACTAQGSPLPVPCQSLTAESWPDPLSTPAVVLLPLCSGDSSARDIFWAKFESSALDSRWMEKCHLITAQPPLPTLSGGLLSRAGRIQGWCRSPVTPLGCVLRPLHLPWPRFHRPKTWHPWTVGLGVTGRGLVSGFL